MLSTTTRFSTGRKERRNEERNCKEKKEKKEKKRKRMDREICHIHFKSWDAMWCYVKIWCYIVSYAILTWHITMWFVVKWFDMSYQITTSHHIIVPLHDIAKWWCNKLKCVYPRNGLHVLNCVQIVEWQEYLLEQNIIARLDF